MIHNHILERAAITVAILMLLVGARTEAAVLVVKPGESIQAALDQAQPGDEVRVAPSEYNESLVITTESVKLIGEVTGGDRPVLDGAQGELEAIRCAADNVEISGFAIRNYLASGITVHESDDVLVSNCIVEKSGAIGIIVSASENTSVTGSVLRGHTDAGLLGTGATKLALSNSEAYYNSSGVRLENCLSFTLDNNSLHHNATGLAMLRLPGGEGTAYGRVFYNRIWANNEPNQANPGSVGAAMIQGVGIYAIGTDHVEVGNNRLEKNGTYASMVMGLAHSNVPRKPPEGETWDTQHYYQHHNLYEANGTNASSQFEKAYPDTPPGDIYFDGQGERNQFQERGEFKTIPETLVQELGGTHTNVMHFL